MSTRPLETPAPIGEARTDSLRTLIAVVDRLRDPDGCPWDREQTVKSLAPHVIEEAFEVVEAIEDLGDADIREELGDLLMGIVLISRVAEQEGRFDLSQVAEGVSEKLIRRHPHVFGDVQADDADAAIESWEAVKKRERQSKQTDSSAVAGVPKALPALQRAKRLGQKAIAAGFKWETPRGALAKVHEELAELDEALENEAVLDNPKAPWDEAKRKRAEDELGDLFLAASQLAAYLKLDPEKCAREAVRRFEGRFRFMEAGLEKPMDELSLDVLTQAWEAAKAEEAE